MVQWLAAQLSVHWVAPIAAVKLHNWQGTAIVQSAAAAPDPPVPLTQDGGSHPVWAAGLTGAGQIIGGGDSGIGAHPPCPEVLLRNPGQHISGHPFVL